MAKVTLYLDKSIEQNAALYYEKAKKIKRKLEGAKAALGASLKKLEKLEKKQEKEVKQIIKKEERKQEWYEKFRWFISSDGFLVIGGRDATSNEIVIKKHTEANDLVLHTDLAGSPFFVIKSQGREIPKKTIEEAAQATAAYSKAWKLGLSSLEVFYVKPEQVSKKTKSGEYMGKGAFMIYGETNYLRPNINLAIGIKENQIIGGPISAVKANAEKFIIIEQGREKASDTAKKVKARFGGDLDEIIRFLPSGGYQIVQ